MEPIEDFDRIHLNLENCIVPRERIENTPSAKQGMSHELEVDLRIVGCEYIQAAGLLLQLPQVAMATAQVLFQRFYYAKSFIDFKVRPMAMACLFVAAKIEEDCRKIRDVVNVFHHLSQKRTGRPIVPMEYMGDEYFTLKPLVIKYERRLLKELGFCVHVKHPHKLIVTYLQILEMEKNTTLAQNAWNYMNDSLRTNVFVRFSPETIACACIFLSARQLKIVLPLKPAWWTLFSVELRDLEAISREILALYSHPRKNLEELERDVAVLKIKIASTKHIEIKEVNLKRKEEGSSMAPSPSSSSQQDQPKGEETSTSRDSTQQAEPAATVDSSCGPSPAGAPSSSLSTSQESSSTAVPAPVTSSQEEASSPVRNGEKIVAPKRSLSLSPSHHKQSSRSSSPSPKRRTSQSDRSRSRSPQHKRKRTSTSPKRIISPIKFLSSSESHSEQSYSLSPSPPPPLSSRENGLPRQYRQDYHEHKQRHKHRSHKDKRERARHHGREAEKYSRRHRHRRDRDRDYYDIPEREKGHYSLSRRDRDRDFDRERDYYRKSDPSRYR